MSDQRDRLNEIRDIITLRIGDKARVATWIQQRIGAINSGGAAYDAALQEALTARPGAHQ